MNISEKSKESGHRREKRWDEEDNLRELFEHMLKDIYWVEKTLVKAIPKMIKYSKSRELMNVLSNHLTQTEAQVKCTEKVFESIGIRPQVVKCEAMEGILKEGNFMMDEFEEGWVRDAAIIGSAQKIKHYEIASYGTLVAYARILGEDEAISYLEKTLNEEKQADRALTELAVSTVNVEAMLEH